MDKFTSIVFLWAFLLYINPTRAQLAYSEALIPAQTNKIAERQRTKPVSYTSFGYCLQLNKHDIVAGGTTLLYKKFGTFLAYKVGIRNWFLPENGERGLITYENVEKNKWTITGNEQSATTAMLSGGITIPISKRIPFYFGAGFSRKRVMFEYIDPTQNHEPRWNVHPNKTQYELNYTGGMFLPLGRFLLNVGYDHNPQCIFVGIGISGRFVYEDADEWWWKKKDKSPKY